MRVRVLLKDDVPSLGLAGEVKEVKAGYARNYLLPNDLAYRATPGAERQWAQDKVKKEKGILERRARAKSLAEKLDGLTLEITARAGPDGKLYGSVTPVKVVEVLAQNGIQVERRHLQIPHPIRTTGDHTAEIQLGHGLRATIQISVAGELVRGAAESAEPKESQEEAPPEPAQPSA